MLQIIAPVFIYAIEVNLFFKNYNKFIYNINLIFIRFFRHKMLRTSTSCLCASHLDSDQVSDGSRLDFSSCFASHKHFIYTSFATSPIEYTLFLLPAFRYWSHSLVQFTCSSSSIRRFCSLRRSTVIGIIERKRKRERVLQLIAPKINFPIGFGLRSNSSHKLIATVLPSFHVLNIFSYGLKFSLFRWFLVTCFEMLLHLLNLQSASKSEGEQSCALWFV